MWKTKSEEEEKELVKNKNYLNIRVEKGLAEQLRMFGIKGETYNDVIQRLLNERSEENV